MFVDIRRVAALLRFSMAMIFAAYLPLTTFFTLIC